MPKDWVDPLAKSRAMARNLKERQLRAIRELRDDYDHVFISPEGVDRFTEPFGFKSQVVFSRYDTREEIKGLALESGPGTEAEGADAADLAEEIANHVIPGGFTPWQMGRGSRLRTACATVEKYLTGTWLPEGESS